jgi:hypothetical protein
MSLSIALAAMLLAPAPVAPAAGLVVESNDKVRCKLVGKPASRLRQSQVCMTESEWRKVASNQRSVAEKMQESGRTQAMPTPR